MNSSSYDLLADKTPKTLLVIYLDIFLAKVNLLEKAILHGSHCFGEKIKCFFLLSIDLPPVSYCQ